MSKSKTKPAQKKTKKPSKAPSVKSKVAAPPQQEQPKRGRGRPTAYKPEYADMAFKYCLLGATDDKLAEFFGVTVQTINNWKTSVPEFFDSMVEGKKKADAEVAHALYKKATGYVVEQEKLVGKGDDRKLVKVKVHIPADTVAQQFWLRNRDRQNWTDVKHMEVGGPGSFDTLTDEDLDKFIMERQMLDLYDAEPGSDSVN